MLKKVIKRSKTPEHTKKLRNKFYLFIVHRKQTCRCDAKSSTSPLTYFSTNCLELLSLTENVFKLSNKFVSRVFFVVVPIFNQPIKNLEKPIRNKAQDFVSLHNRSE